MNRTSLVATTAALLTAGGLAFSASGAATAAQHSTSHRLTFTSHTLASTQSGKNHLTESDRAVKSGTTIGYGANSCTFDFTSGKVHCLVTLARPQGQLRCKVTVDGSTGHVAGRVVGGSGVYRGASGTVTGDPGTRPDTVKITMQWSN